MKVSVRTFSATLFLPMTMLLFTGCGKKAVKAPDPESKITQSIATTRPSPRGLPATRPSTGTAEDQSSQLLALRGEDIPISEPPSLEFIEPSAEDKLILRNIYFDFDRSSIRPDFQPVMEGIAEWLNRNGHKQLLIEGHCDERGTSEYNLALGERRSLSVRKYLVGLGISPDRLHTISYGEEMPAVSGHDESAWAENRRAEFKVSAN